MDINDDPEVREARQRWLNDGSALPVVELMASRGAKIEAAAVARVALARPDCPDAEELRAVLSNLASPPAGWEASLAKFAESPSREAWSTLMRFVPPDHAYLRLRDVIGRLRALGVEGDMIFRCASTSGLTPDLIELVEQGGVAVETLVERTAQSGGAKTTYLGLAAEAAFLAGDMLGTVRLLRESMKHENEWCSAEPHVIFIRERAAPEQLDLLDRAGIPRT